MMHRVLHILIIASFVIASMAGSILGVPEVSAQSDDRFEQQIDNLIAKMSPEIRVGQLMLVTFDGTYLGPDAPVAELVSEYGIGGVVLLTENDNIDGQFNTPRLVRSLTDDLQALAFATSQAGGTPVRPFVPLFVAVTHDGNGQPGTQIATETTPVPSLMALGATWETEYARQVGQIVGHELTAMGVNMLLGPALDVYPQSTAEHTLDLGVNSFGGQPYWVGKMAQAYVTGTHEGGAGRLAVIARDFPGLGMADTKPDQEIPVVPRSAEELRQFDLIPYAAVTGEAATEAATVDGIQCANIRYQGRNIRSITRPVCVDEQAAAQLLSLDYFVDWREEGIVVSSALGTRAIRRFYDVTPFPHRQIAREALLAGNDLLLLADFGPEAGSEQLENIADVIQFFAESYEDDPVFRDRIDVSLRRILRLKLTLYDGEFTLENVQAETSLIDDVGKADSVLYGIAQHSVTLLSPRSESLPSPPARDEDIVIFTDVRLVRQCSFCASYPLVPVNALEIAIERLYGPYAGAQVRPERVTSFSFSQLASYVQGDPVAEDSEGLAFKTNQRIAESLRDVGWIVFVMLGMTPEYEGSTLLRDLMERESPILDRANIIVLALGAPTYLSSTEISKLTAYYGVYSHIAPFIDAAARALFQETSLVGRLPISVSAVGYDVSEMTNPDPTQTIRLEIETLDGSTPPVGGTASDVLTMQVGEALALRTLPIVDRNGHVVPDNTPVEFALTFVSDNLQTRQYGSTQDGIALTGFTPTRPGRVQIAATSLDATRSRTFQIVVVGEGFPFVGEGAADANPTIAALTESAPAPNGPQGTADAMALGPAALPGSGETSQADAAAQPEDGANSTETTTTGTDLDEGRRAGWRELGWSLMGLVLISGLAFSAGLAATYSGDGGVRVVLGGLVAGLVGYIYYALGGPGADVLRDHFDATASVIVTVASGLIGMVFTGWALWQDYK